MLLQFFLSTPMCTVGAIMSYKETLISWTLSHGSKNFIKPPEQYVALSLSSQTTVDTVLRHHFSYEIYSLSIPGTPNKFPVSPPYRYLVIYTAATSARYYHKHHATAVKLCQVMGVFLHNLNQLKYSLQRVV